jgi:hypothetical protein
MNGHIRFGKELEAVLRTLPQSGPLFPKLKPMQEAHRATEFARACRRLMIKGIILRSYRYVWAERAKTCGYMRHQLLPSRIEGAVDSQERHP